MSVYEETTSSLNCDSVCCIMVQNLLAFLAYLKITKQNSNSFETVPTSGVWEDVEESPYVRAVRGFPQ